MLLKDKIVIVSGIGPGLGIELSTRSAMEGAGGVAVAARTPAKLDDAERAIRDAGLDTPVLKVPTDISDKAASEALVAAALERFGRVDVLLNSAYIPGRFQPVEEADMQDWQNTFQVNVCGTMNLSQAAVKPMKEQGGGAIVMVNSMVTRKPMPTQAGYAASKAALTAATSHLAHELGRHRIRVNSIYMGWMWGPPVQGYFEAAAPALKTTPEAMKAEVEKNIPLGEIPDDADCAKAAVMLASDYACVVTGACLDANGGEYMPH